MGLFSEIIAEHNIKEVYEIRDRYLADDRISAETKEVIRKLISEVVCVVSD